jgi:DNA-3-methyladenine glycosylase I
MNNTSAYCTKVLPLAEDNPHRIYHDQVYGRPAKDDRQLFELLILEINQAGLSWNTIINKRENFRKAYDSFDFHKIALYGDEEKQALMANPGIIRHRAKIEAAVYNAQVVLGLLEEYGSFRRWLDHFHPLSHAEWTKLFKKTFRFTGGEIVSEFLMSCGYLPGAHAEDCPVFAEVLKSNPPWVHTDL